MTATLLLAIFGFILAEKNTHAHPGLPLAPASHDHMVIHPVASCLICEFQLAADADLPPLAEIHFPLPVYRTSEPGFSVSLSGITCIHPAERGPPARA